MTFLMSVKGNSTLRWLLLSHPTSQPPANPLRWTFIMEAEPRSFTALPYPLKCSAPQVSPPSFFLTLQVSAQESTEAFLVHHIQRNTPSSALFFPLALIFHFIYASTCLFVLSVFLPKHTRTGPCAATVKVPCSDRPSREAATGNQADSLRLLHVQSRNSTDTKPCFHQAAPN